MMIHALPSLHGPVSDRLFHLASIVAKVRDTGSTMPPVEARILHAHLLQLACQAQAAEAELGTLRGLLPTVAAGPEGAA